MVKAAGKGHMNVVKFCTDKDATDFDDAMVEAAKYDHIDVVKFCAGNGATAFNLIMQ